MCAFILCSVKRIAIIGHLLHFAHGYNSLEQRTSVVYVYWQHTLWIRLCLWVLSCSRIHCEWQQQIQPFGLNWITFDLVWRRWLGWLTSHKVTRLTTASGWIEIVWWTTFSGLNYIRFNDGDWVYWKVCLTTNHCERWVCASVDQGPAHHYLS